MAVRLNYDDLATWQLVYRTKNRDPASPEHGQSYTYGRKWARHLVSPHQGDADPLAKYLNRRANLPGVIDNSKGLVVGCGFGFLLEALIDAGIADVWGTDTSQFIHDNLAAEGRSDTIPRIFQKDIRDADALQFFRDQTGGGGRFNWIVTEEMLSSYDDADLPGLLDACENLLGGGPGGNARIVHIVLPNANAPLNGKTLAEWAAIRPDHTWISTSGEVA